MTNLAETLPRAMVEGDKLSLIKELRGDTEFLSGVRRGLEARRKGDSIAWNDVKAELAIK